MPLANGSSMPPSSAAATSEIGEDMSESAITVAGPSSLIPAVHRNGGDHSSDALQPTKQLFGGHQPSGAALSRRRGGNVGGH